MKIMGIDPGLGCTGWAVISVNRGDAYLLDCGVIRTKPTDPIDERLHKIHRGCSDVIEFHSPNVAAIESIFVNTNPRSSLKLESARGAIILTMAIAGLQVREYSSTQVKRAVTGFGRAEKGDVAQMVQRILNIECDKMAADAFDAIAIALCHAHSMQSA